MNAPGLITGRWVRALFPAIKPVKILTSRRYPLNNGLRSGFLIVRRHTPKIAKFNELWWNEVDRGSVRDQLSIDYALWKLGIEPVDIPGDLFRGPHYERKSHRRR